MTYTVEQAAVILQRTEEQVRRYIRSGKLKAHLSGSRKKGYVISIEDLLEFTNQTKLRVQKHTLKVPEIDDSVWTDFCEKHKDEIIDRIANKVAAYIAAKL